MTEWLVLLEGKVSGDDLERARQEKYYKRDPADFLLANRLVTQESLLSAFSEHYHLPAIYADKCRPAEDALDLISEEVARRYQMLPLFKEGDHLYVALANPEDLAAQDFVAQLTRLTVEPVLATKPSIEIALNRFYVSKERAARAFGEMTLEEAAARETEKAAAAPESIHVEDTEAPAVKLTDYVFSQAIRLNASDIHLEPFADRVLLRYRVDGILHEYPPPPFDLCRAVVARIKILANLDVTERRLPQDGRIRTTVDDREYDLRVSIIPNLHGEALVIRILDPGGGKKELLDYLGFAPALLSRYKKIITAPYGIFLVTGPTGSGKTSTLYATLKHILTPKKKIVTLEDPVEYQLYGVTQFQVNPEIDFTFAKGLRSILRHDPDVIMLGEIRDLESAEIAVQSSLTGHLVFSTLHTNDAPSAVTRLVDMGVQPYLVLSSLIGVLAQRLVRRLCPKCKVEIAPGAAELAALGSVLIPERRKIHRPCGCQECNQIGYKGRIAIGELLEITPQMRRLSAEEMSAETVREMAKEQGFVDLAQSAVDLLCTGLTSLEEVWNILGHAR